MNSPRTRIAVSVQPVALIRVNFRPNSREFERVLNAATRGCLPLKARPPAVRTPAPARAPWPLSGPTCRSLRDLMPGGVSIIDRQIKAPGLRSITGARAEMFVGEVKSDGSWSESDNWYRARRRSRAAGIDPLRTFAIGLVPAENARKRSKPYGQGAPGATVTETSYERVHSGHFELPPPLPTPALPSNALASFRSSVSKPSVNPPVDGREEVMCFSCPSTRPRRVLASPFLGTRSNGRGGPTIRITWKF